MAAQLATNYVPAVTLVSAWVGAGVAIVWYILRITEAWRKRVILLGLGAFALLGIAVLLVGGYYAASPRFANTFRYYAYSVFAPPFDPFGSPVSDSAYPAGYGEAIIMAGIDNRGNVVHLYHHPVVESPTSVTLFTQGRFTSTDLRGDVLTVATNTPSSLPSITETSLWWALTRDLGRVVSSEE